jgi:RNA polymerase sigma-70 factor (family 1)
MARRPITLSETLSFLNQGKEVGLQTLFQLYFKPLCFYAHKLTRDAALAEELAQDVFVAFWERREEFYVSEEARVKSWLYTTLRNRAIDHLRKVKRMRVGMEGLQRGGAEEVVTQNALSYLIETETVHQVLRTLELLPPRCREVFRLYYLKGLSYEEIAQEMKITERTARNQKGRAVQLLKEKMAEHPYVFALLVTSALMR